MLCALPVGSVRTDTEMIERRALDSLIIIMRNADEHSEIGSFFEIEHESGVFDCFPCSFEQQSMLRIYVGRFPRRDTKELRIKLIDCVDKSAAKRDRFSSHARFRIVIPLDIPAIGWNLNDAFTAFDEKFPQRVLRSHAAGKTAADSNNRNTFFLHGHELLRRGGRLALPVEHVKVSYQPGCGDMTLTDGKTFTNPTSIRF